MLLAGCTEASLLSPNMSEGEESIRPSPVNHAAGSIEADTLWVKKFTRIVGETALRSFLIFAQNRISMILFNPVILKK